MNVPIISKSDLAAELGVTKARVSQYLKAGLPERSDRKLDRDAAIKWLSEHAVSGTDLSKGPARARRLRETAKPAPAEPAEVVAIDPVSAPADPRLAATEAALRRLFDRSAGIIAAVVLHAGGSMPTAYAAAFMARAELAGFGDEALQALGLDLSRESLRLDADPDWPALAAEAGQTFDPAECERFTRALPYYADPDHPGFA